MFASVLRLTRSDIKRLRIIDAYSLHRIVYGLYDDIRSDIEKQTSIPSGILYADKGGDWNSRSILMLSNRLPNNTIHTDIDFKPIPESFLHHQNYKFEVKINPTKRDKLTKKIVPIIGRDQVAQWFIDKASKTWGFSVTPSNLQIQELDVQIFKKKGHQVTHGSATLIGTLTVIDRGLFIQSFKQGIGRGRAFGFGLLQIVPVTNK